MTAKRTPIIAANWKMNHTVSTAMRFLDEFIPAVSGEEGIEIVVCPPFTALDGVGQRLRGSGIKLGAQNVFWEEAGAYTGEISPSMLRELGCEYVIVGHSERRSVFGESDREINMKLKALMRAGLTPILCVGERLKEREENRQEEVVRGQLEEGLEGLTPEWISGIVIAYEPVWAIGTGRNARPEDANDMNSMIRDLISSVFGRGVGDSVRIQYGGSVNAGNISSFMAMTEVDGALVGGASLDPVSFAEIVKRSSRR